MEKARGKTVVFAPDGGLSFAFFSDFSLLRPSAQKFEELKELCVNNRLNALATATLMKNTCHMLAQCFQSSPALDNKKKAHCIDVLTMTQSDIPQLTCLLG